MSLFLQCKAKMHKTPMKIKRKKTTQVSFRGVISNCVCMETEHFLIMERKYCQCHITHEIWGTPQTLNPTLKAVM